MPKGPSTKTTLYNNHRNLSTSYFILLLAIVLDVLLTAILVTTLFVWRMDAYAVSVVDISIYLWHVAHLLAAPGSVALVFGLVNFYYWNIICVLYSFCALGDAVAIIWRAVRISYLESGDLGLWLQTLTLTLAILLFLVSTTATVVAILLTRGLKVNYQVYVQWVRDNDRSITLPSVKLFSLRSAIRALTSIDLILYCASIIVRAVFYYGVGYWFMPYLQLGHAFLFLWLMALVGSDEYKLGNITPSDASLSNKFVLLVTTTVLVLLVVDVAVLTTGILELTGSVGDITIVELVAGTVTLVLTSLLIMYDGIVGFTLLALTDLLKDSQKNAKTVWTEYSENAKNSVRRSNTVESDKY